LVLPSIKEAVKSRSVHPSVSPSAAEAVPAALEQCSTLPSNFRKSSSTSKMALCAPSSLDVRIDELLKTPEDPGSPNRLADISFGMDPFGDLGQLADHSFRMDLVGDLSKSISPARSSSVARTVSAAVSVNPSISQSRPSLGQLADHSLGLDPVGDLFTSILPTRSSSVARMVSAAVSVNPSRSQLPPSLGVGDVSMVLGRWPHGVDEAWELLRPGLQMPMDNSDFAQEFRTVRSTARVMAGLILSLPGFEDVSERLPGCVVDWLCRFFR
jgi:hypothetical protein